jgi:molecular chaperone GrpE
MGGKKIPINAERPKPAAQETDTASELRVIDKRRFTDTGQVAADSQFSEKPRYPSFVEEQLAKLEHKRQQFEQEIVKTRARIEADYDRKLEIEKRNLALPLLEVLDNLERAIEAAKKAGNTGTLLEGVEMTANLFRSKLQMIGVEPLEILDQPFDPNLSQAVGVIEVTDESRDGVIEEQLVPGYRMGDQLLRPAQVRVGRFNPGKESGARIQEPEY